MRGGAVSAASVACDRRDRALALIELALSMPRRRPSTFASWDACLPHSAIWLAETSLGRPKRISAGTVIYAQGEAHAHFYLIRAGFVQTTMTHESGRRLTLELMGPGSMFGEGAAFDGAPRFVDNRAATDCELSAYLAADVMAAGALCPPLLESLIKIMGAKQRILAAKLLEFSSEDPQLRLRHLLVRLLSVQQRTEPAGGERVNQIWINQEQLGEMCGMSRVRAARALRRLGAAGLIRTHPRFVEVLDARRLAVE